MRSVTADLVRRDEIARLDDFAPLSLGPVDRYRLGDGTVTLVDATLLPVRSVPVDVPPGARPRAATPDLSQVVVADPRTLMMIDGERRVDVALPDVDSVTIVDAPYVLATAKSGTAHRIVLVDAASGTIADEHALDVYDAMVAAVVHPADGSVLLDAGEGQDGNTVVLARAAGGRLVVEPLFTNVIAACFNPAGDRLLMLPHPNFGASATILSWPRREPVAELAPGDLELDDDDGLDFYGCFGRRPRGPGRTAARSCRRGADVGAAEPERAQRTLYIGQSRGGLRRTARRGRVTRALDRHNCQALVAMEASGGHNFMAVVSILV